MFSGDFGGFKYKQGLPWDNLKQTSTMQDSFIRSAADDRRRGYNEGQAYQDAAYKPYKNVGNAFTEQLLNLLQDPSYLRSMPGYQFGLDEMSRTLQNSAAAKSGLYSGNAMAALDDRAKDYSDTFYGNEFNRLMGGMQTGHGFDQTYADRSTDLATGKGFSDAQMYGDFSNYINKHEDAGLDLIKNWSTLSGWTGQGSGFKENTKSKDTNANNTGGTQSSGPTNFSATNTLYNYPVRQTDYPGGDAGWFAEDMGGWF